jgi:nucleoid-associated protein
MVINNAIIHKLVSEQHKKEVSIFPRATEISLPDTNANTLLDSINISYEKDTDIAYAGFDEIKWFPNQLIRFINKEIIFYNFTVSCLEKLKEIMELVPPATGGYLVIYYYTEEQNDYIMVILLKDKEGIVIDDKLDIIPIQNLDLDKLHFAAKINLTRFLSNNEKIKRNHISFLKGKYRTYVVDYFKRFLGIDEDMYFDPHRSNLDFVNLVKDFADTKDSIVKRDEIIDNAYKYAKIQIENNEPISIKYLANSSSPDDPDEFLTFIKDKRFELPGEFQGDEKVLNKLIRYHSKTKNYSITFYKQAIDDGIITLNSQDQLVIKEVSDYVLKIFKG